MTGIVLGFGTANSISGSRFETLSEPLLTCDIPPYRARLDLNFTADFSEAELKDIYIFSQRDLCYPVNVEQSLGYTSIEEEYSELQKEIKIKR